MNKLFAVFNAKTSKVNFTKSQTHIERFVMFVDYK